LKRKAVQESTKYVDPGIRLTLQNQDVSLYLGYCAKKKCVDVVLQNAFAGKGSVTSVIIDV